MDLEIISDNVFGSLNTAPLLPLKFKEDIVKDIHLWKLNQSCGFVLNDYFDNLDKEYGLYMAYEMYVYGKEIFIELDEVTEDGWEPCGSYNAGFDVVSDIDPVGLLEAVEYYLQQQGVI